MFSLITAAAEVIIKSCRNYVNLRYFNVRLSHVLWLTVYVQRILLCNRLGQATNRQNKRIYKTNTETVELSLIFV